MLIFLQAAAKVVHHGERDQARWKDHWTEENRGCGRERLSIRHGGLRGASFEQRRPGLQVGCAAWWRTYLTQAKLNSTFLSRWLIDLTALGRQQSMNQSTAYSFYRLWVELTPSARRNRWKAKIRSSYCTLLGRRESRKDWSIRRRDISCTRQSRKNWSSTIHRGMFFGCLADVGW